MSLVVVVDHGLCNIGSVRRAIEECGGRASASADPAALRKAQHIVLPGVGSFASGMAHLRDRGWDEALREAVVDQGVPILGICLGMQLFADLGHEGGPTRGLGLVAGEVVQMEPHTDERLPHVGWNEVAIARPNRLFASIPTHTDFYFVHSFHFVPTLASTVVGTTPYCGNVTAAIEQGTIFGVQFHPEKSSKAGFQLIRNFLGA